MKEFNKQVFIKHCLLFSRHHGGCPSLLYRADVCVGAGGYIATHVFTHISLYVSFTPVNIAFIWDLITCWLSSAKVIFLCFFCFQSQHLIFLRNSFDAGEKSDENMEHTLLGHCPRSFIVSKHKLHTHTCFKSEIAALFAGIGDQCPP